MIKNILAVTIVCVAALLLAPGWSANGLAQQDAPAPVRLQLASGERVPDVAVASDGRVALVYGDDRDV